MSTITFDTQELVHELRSSGIPLDQAEAVVRTIVKSHSELVTKQSLQIELAPIRARLDLLQWMVGFNLAFTMAVLWKVFS